MLRDNARLGAFSMKSLAVGFIQRLLVLAAAVILIGGFGIVYGHFFGPSKIAMMLIEGGGVYGDNKSAPSAFRAVASNPVLRSRHFLRGVAQLRKLYALAFRPPQVSLIHLEADPLVDPAKQVETMHPFVLFVQSA
jgi:hypothetical protein